MKNLDNYYLWQIPARIDPSLDLLICVGKFHRKPFLALTNSRSFSSSHYIVTLVINKEHYGKGDEWM